MKSRYCWSVCTALLLLLAGCSDSDSGSNDSQTLINEQVGGTSEPAPEGDVPENPLSSTPGGDTTAIAGLWDTRSEGNSQVDERYVLITPEGLYWEYDYRQDDLANDGNCYLAYGPLTLTPENATADTYSLPDERYFSATRNENNSVISVTYAGTTTQDWVEVTGISQDDLNGCANIQD